MNDTIIGYLYIIFAPLISRIIAAIIIKYEFDSIKRKKYYEGGEQGIKDETFWIIYAVIWMVFVDFMINKDVDQLGIEIENVFLKFVLHLY